jgi:3-hydroxybutyryl-CoA dehydratase
MINPESMNMRRLEPDDIVLGRKFSITKTITDADIYTFAGIVGDFNPIHVNDVYAKPRMGGRIAHGMLTASFMSTIMGMGFTCNSTFLEEHAKFKKPVHPHDTITATGEIVDITFTKSGRRIVTIKVTIVNQNDEAVLEGECKNMSLEAVK